MQFRADAEKIKRWREERHWSQEHLAELAGIGLRTVQRIEKGEQASGESIKALAAAFNVDVMALTVDAQSRAAKAATQHRAEGVAALRLSFWIHLGSWGLGMLIFAAIGVSERNILLMAVPAMWWTVGLASHALTVMIVTLVSRYQNEMQPTD
jgi:transcriptional regulator with XRE-family HTH domain